jgi:hypothetical protein
MVRALTTANCKPLQPLPGKRQEASGVGERGGYSATTNGCGALICSALLCTALHCSALTNLY